VNRLAREHRPIRELGTTRRTETVDGRAFTLRETVLSGPGVQLLAWHWIRVGGHDTSSDFLGKLWQACARLTLRAGDGAAVIAATPLGEDKEAARAMLRAFLATNLTQIDATLAATEGH
jgi:EpsI family protein